MFEALALAGLQFPIDLCSAIYGRVRSSAAPGSKLDPEARCGHRIGLIIPLI